MKKQLLLLAVATMTTAAGAYGQLQLQSVGSSAQFQTATIAAFNQAGAGAGHFTFKSGGQIIDNRGVAAIVPQSGNLSVVWNAPQTNVWTYLSVDSVVGNRAYFSQPRATLTVTAAAIAGPGGNLISAALLGGVADAAAIPAAVLALIQGKAFTAAFTDILPADALFAEQRVNCGTPTTATTACLGYTTANPNVGLAINSFFSTANAQPVGFAIFGTDPITSNPIPAFTTVPIGVAPIIFIANRTNLTNLGNGNYTDMTYDVSAIELFSGVDCDSTAFGRALDFSNAFAINPILREPLSGTMNTIEYNIFVTQVLSGAAGQAAGYFSQEGQLVAPYSVPSAFSAIQPGNANSNPLNLTCGGAGSPYAAGPQGNRKRAIGTGEEVSSVKATADSIGYIFFGYGNVSSIAGQVAYGYLTLHDVDPINPSAAPGPTGYGPAIVGNPSWNGGGQLPTCTQPCAVPEGSSFPNVRNGAYQAISVLRGVADTGSVALANLTSLAANIADEINATQPDFLPYKANSFGDPGFLGYRIHFAPPGVNFNAGNVPNNGLPGEIPAGVEAGGDVGGCLDYKTDPNQLNCRH